MREVSFPGHKSWSVFGRELADHSLASITLCILVMGATWSAASNSCCHVLPPQRTALSNMSLSKILPSLGCFWWLFCYSKEENTTLCFATLLLGRLVLSTLTSSQRRPHSFARAQDSPQRAPYQKLRKIKPCGKRHCLRVFEKPLWPHD